LYDKVAVTRRAGNKSPLEAAIVSRLGNYQTVAELVELEPDITYVNTQGETLLHITVEGTHPEKDKVITLLIQKGVPVDHPDIDGTTALHLALRLDDAKALKALIRAGARTDIPNNNNKTALDVAQQLQTNTAKYLVQSLKNERSEGDHDKELLRRLCAESTSVKTFYDRMERKLVELLGVHKYDNKGEGIDEGSDFSLTLLSKTFDIPAAKVKFFRGCIQADVSTSDISSFGDLNFFVRMTAAQFTLRYAEQISLLKDKAPEDLADFVIRHLMCALESGHLSMEQPILPQLLDAIAYGNLPKGRKLAVEYKFRPVVFNCRGVLQHCGIELSDGTRYRMYNVSKPEKYMFRRGTQSEIDTHDGWNPVD
jgi:hypothetical protein